jgi:hypothetical protein
MKKSQIRDFENYYFNTSESDFQNVYNIIRYLKGQEELVAVNQPWIEHINYINSNIDPLFFEKCKSFFDLSKAMFEIGCIDLSKHPSSSFVIDVFVESKIPFVEEVLEQLGSQLQGITVGDILELDSAYKKHSNETANDGGYGIKILLKSEVLNLLEEFDEDVISDINQAFISNEEWGLKSFDVPKWCSELAEKWKDTFVEDDADAENCANILSKIYPIALLANTPKSSDITPYDNFATIYNEVLDEEVKFSYASMVQASKDPDQLKALINRNILFDALSESSASLKPGIPEPEGESASLKPGIPEPEGESADRVLWAAEFNSEVIKRLNKIENIAKETLKSTNGGPHRRNNTGYAYKEPSRPANPSSASFYKDGSNNSPIDSRKIRETRKAEMKMEEEQGFISKVLDVAKEDGKEALLRVTVRQTIKTVKAPLVEAFASRAGGTTKREKNKNMKAAADFLDSEFGEAFICHMISAALIHMPVGGNEEIREAFAKEFRVQGYTEVGNMVVNYLMDPIRDSLSALTSALKENESLAPAIAAAKEVSTVEVPPAIKEAKVASAKKIKQSVNA